MKFTLEIISKFLCPHIERMEKKIMTAIDDLGTSLEELKTQVGRVASGVEDIAKAIHDHPSTQDDSKLQGFVGELNTLAAQLKGVADSTGGLVTDEENEDAGTTPTTPPLDTDPTAPVEGSGPVDPNAPSSPLPDDANQSTDAHLAPIGGVTNPQDGDTGSTADSTLGTDPTAQA